MKRFLLSALVMLALAGCGGQNEASKGKGEAPSKTGPKAPPLKQLRIAIEAKTTKPCAEDAPDWPDAQRGHARHMAERMEIPVTLCAMASRKEIAEALAAGTIEMGLLDREAYMPVKASVRPILTERIPVELGRAVAVIAVPEKSALRSLPDADRAKIIMSQRNPQMLYRIKQTMTTVGMPAETLEAGTVVANVAEALSAMRAGNGDAAVLNAAEWYRHCRGDKQNPKPCQGFREIWRGRSPADQAWSVKRDISLESHARIVGIHVALFQEKPEIAKWLAPRTTEIEPTEATALEPAR